MSAWPPVDHEVLEWRDSWRTYRAAIPASISGLEVTEHLSAAVVADAAKAQQEITEFDRRLTERFGPGELGTVATVLMRTESASSSHIEHITASARQLALADIGESRSVNARLVASNVDAMKTSIALSASVDLAAILSMHEALMADTDITLGLRQEQVWIGTSGSSPIGADFVPPHHDRLGAALEDLITYTREPATLPLAMAAVAHAQFETIHPFVDGNGRVGRALVHALLRRDRVAEHLTVPVSAGLLADTRIYVQALTAFRAGDPSPIVARFAEAARHAVAIGEELLERLAAVELDWRERLTARTDSAVWPLSRALLAHPAVTSSLVMERHGVSRPAAMNAITALVEGGVLLKVSTGRRNQVWVASEVTAVYDRVAEMIGRRRGYDL